MSWSRGMRSHSNMNRTSAPFDVNARTGGYDGPQGKFSGNTAHGGRLGLGLQARSSEGPLSAQGIPYVAEPYIGANRVKVPPLKLLNKNNFFIHTGQGAANHLGGQQRALDDLAKNLGSLRSVEKSVVEDWKESGSKPRASGPEHKNFELLAADYDEFTQNSSMAAHH